MSAPTPPRARPEITLTTDIKPEHYDALARLHIAAFDPSWISKRINPPEKQLDMEMRVGQCLLALSGSVSYLSSASPSESS